MADIDIATLWVHPSFGIGQRLLGRRFSRQSAENRRGQQTIAR